MTPRETLIFLYPFFHSSLLTVAPSLFHVTVSRGQNFPRRDGSWRSSSHRPWQSSKLIRNYHFCLGRFGPIVVSIELILVVKYDVSGSPSSHLTSTGLIFLLTTSHNAPAPGASRPIATEETRASPRHLLNRSEHGFENPTSRILSFRGTSFDAAPTILGKWQLKADD